MSGELKAESIAVQYRGVSLSFLKELKQENSRMNGYGLLTSLVMPTTKDRKISLAELWSQKVSGRYKAFGNVSVFISHAWRNRFGALVEAISAWEISVKSEEDVVYYFFDIFAINQWNPKRDLRAIGDIIAGSNALVLVLSPLRNPIPVSRVWCLFEIYSAIKTETPVMAALPDRERKQFEMLLLTSNDYHNLIGIKIDSRNADATHPDDCLRIKHVIKSEIGFVKLNRQIYFSVIELLHKIALEAVEYAQGTPMFEEYLAGFGRLSNEIEKILSVYDHQICIEDNNKKYDQDVQNILWTKTNWRQIACADKKSNYVAKAKQGPIYTDAMDRLLYQKAFFSLKNIKEKHSENLSDIFEWTTCYRNSVDMALLALLEIFSECNIPPSVFEIILEFLPCGWRCGGIKDETLTTISSKKDVNSARVYKYDQMSDYTCLHVNDDSWDYCAKCNEARFWKCCAGKIKSELIFCSECNEPRWYIVKEGYLKLENQRFKILRRWRRCWFILTRKKLFAFNNWNTLGSPSIELGLSDIVNFDDIEDTICTITTIDSSTYTIAAATLDELGEWLIVIRHEIFRTGITSDQRVWQRGRRWSTTATSGLHVSPR